MDAGFRAPTPMRVAIALPNLILVVTLAVDEDLEGDAPKGAILMSRKLIFPRAGMYVVLVFALLATAGLLRLAGQTNGQAYDNAVMQNTAMMLAEGRQTFRFDTFGSEAFWGGTLQLHRAISGAALGGVGPGVSPLTALQVGLKVDSDALPGGLKDKLAAGQVDLNDPATTLTLLKHDAVVGVKGFFTQGNLSSVGIRCSLCHSTVDNTLIPGVGRRLDGWANRDLNVGAIISLAPNLQPFVTLLSVVHPGITQAQVRTVLGTWGPGKFDAELLLDGKTTNPVTGNSSATLIPPAFGLAGVNLHTWTGWGSVTHWNAFVANLEMQGQGTFYDTRLDNAAQFPIAAQFGFGHKTSNPDLVTPKLPALHFYQLALPAPAPPVGSFNAGLAALGKTLFSGKAQCASCHTPPIYSEPGWNMHLPADIGIESFQADRSPDRRYRTAPLKGLWTHTKGGFYHDGRFATLLDVVNHYNTVKGLGLTGMEKDQLVEYLKSL